MCLVMGEIGGRRRGRAGESGRERVEASGAVRASRSKQVTDLLKTGASELFVGWLGGWLGEWAEWVGEWAGWLGGWVAR